MGGTARGNTLSAHMAASSTEASEIRAKVGTDTAIARHTTTVADGISPWRLSVAPMMDWTDRHCRYLHRLITRKTRLYTEMVTTAALLHGDVGRHLDYDASEHPIALQLGGSDPSDLARCAELAQQWGYDEVNLNCGCPSERVQQGAFGACLMAEPVLVADCVRAMQSVVDIPITVKNRIGIDRQESYAFLQRFTETVAEAGCTVFAVHARNAWLKGLSPKENRTVPPLRYELVYRLKQEYPQLTVVINGGITNNTEVAAHLRHVDGVMVGREAYHNPLLMAQWDALFQPEDGRTTQQLATPATADADAIEQQMLVYMRRQAVEHAVPWRHIARHMLGLRHGMPRARKWRQAWSNHLYADLAPEEVHALAHGVAPCAK